MARKTTSKYIEDAKAVHGDKYTYENTVYVHSREKLTVTCRVHGDFQVTAFSLLSGHGCGKCRGALISEKRKMSQEDFLLKVEAKYGDKNDYSATNYTRSFGYIEVTCKAHGPFSVRAGNHIFDGSGCEKCSDYSFKKNKPAWLYVLKSNDIVKVGITNREPKRRVSEISNSSERNFDIAYKTYFENGSHALACEDKLLKELASAHERTSEKFNGSTECFLNVPVEALIQKISNFQEEVY